MLGELRLEERPRIGRRPIAAPDEHRREHLAHAELTREGLDLRVLALVP
jgi:hypothetical protein